jgi:exosortase
VGGHRVSVVEACSGVRYLLSLAFIAVVFAYLADIKSWMRWALFVAAVPIAIVANAVRVAVSAAVPALDSGTPHEAAGWAVFVLCLILIFLVHRMFNSIYIWSHDRA